tara:strand:+ start:8395 stop:8628 length:234 start_codon:yes stop_codon:yes gene_type:complete
MGNAWLEHLKLFYSKNKKTMTYKMAMKEAKKSYKPSSKKGTKSKTHKGDKNYTTKKGDKDHHQDGEDVKEENEPYTN